MELSKRKPPSRKKPGEGARPEPGISPGDILPNIPELPTEELRVHSLSQNARVRKAAYEEWVDRKKAELSETLARAKEKKEKAQSLAVIPQKLSRGEPRISKAAEKLKREAYDLEARAKQIQAEIEEHTSRVEAIKNILPSFDPSTPLVVSRIPQIFWDRGGEFKHVKRILDSTRVSLSNVIWQLEHHGSISVDEAIKRAIQSGKPPYHR